MATSVAEVFVGRRDKRPAGRDRVYTDPGTPQLRARRLVASGSVDVSNDFPLDLMLARGFISKAEHEAGWTFARSRWLAFGPPGGSVDSHYRRALQEPLDRKPSVKERMDARIDYEADLERMATKATDWALHEVMRACVFLVRPRWLRWAIEDRHLSSLHRRELAELHAGLKAITHVQRARGNQ